MPLPAENLNVEGDRPGAQSRREESAGPRRREAQRAHPSVCLAKFHAPEIGFGPGALAELGPCATWLGARRPLAAKGVAILSGNGGRILGFEGVDKVIHPIPPTVIVPSTSVTGADVSQFAVITDTAAQRFVPLAEAAGISAEGAPAREVAPILAKRCANWPTRWACRRD
jgi:hypothetical protein